MKLIDLKRLYSISLICLGITTVILAGSDTFPINLPDFIKKKSFLRLPRSFSFLLNPHQRFNFLQTAYISVQKKG